MVGPLPKIHGVVQIWSGHCTDLVRSDLTKSVQHLCAHLVRSFFCAHLVRSFKGFLAPPVGGKTAREWSRAEPRVLVYGWVAR